MGLSHTSEITDKEKILKFVKSRGITHEPIDLLRNNTQSQNIAIQQAMKDFRREKVVFNNVSFIPHSVETYRCESFVKTLYLSAERLARQISVCADEYTHNAHRIAEIILQSSCRTSAGADSYFYLQEIFNIDSVILSQRTSSTEDDPPVMIDLSVHSDNHGVQSLVSTVKVWNFFAVYDRDIMDNNYSDSVGEPCPWIEIESLVIDTYNFRTNEHKRNMELVTYLPAQMKYYYQPTQNTLKVTKSLADESRTTDHKHVFVNSSIQTPRTTDQHSKPISSHKTCSKKKKRWFRWRRFALFRDSPRSVAASKNLESPIRCDIVGISSFNDNKSPDFQGSSSSSKPLLL